MINMRPNIATVLLGFCVGACAHDGAPTGSSVPARAQVADPNGAVVANASARDGNGLTVRVDVAGLPLGRYAVHVHGIGRCDPPQFSSAGPHWNPTVRQHGRLNPLGPHLGDLPNLDVDAQGNGSVTFTVAGATVRAGDHPLLDSDGASIVIHAAADDERTDPSGNSGARIACGVFS